MADDAPPIGSDDDVHSVPAEPRALVEAVLRASRLPDLADEVEDGALRWRPAGGKPEEDRLFDRLPSEAPHLCGDA
jgi:hypothetical protein